MSSTQPRERAGRLVALALAAIALPACTPAPADPVQPTPTESPASTTVGASPSASPAPATESARPVPEPQLSRDLIDAAWKNDLARAAQLITQGADVNAKDDNTESAFLVAASEGYEELLELTIANGADPHSLDSFDGTALIRAAERGHPRISGRLIRAGVEVDHRNNLGWVALHEALLFADRAGQGVRGDEQDYLDTVRVLVASGADVTTPATRDAATPLAMAHAGGLKAQATLLGKTIEQDPKLIDGADRALLEAAASGDADAAALALRAGAAVEARNGSGQTPLLIASAADNTEVARLLVAMGADPDAVDDRSDTPWLVTGVTGSVEMLEILMPADPDLTLTNRFGGLSPIPASERGHVDYLRRVVQTDVDINHVNNLGWTALLEAVILGDGSARYVECVEILLAAGADPSIADADGVTARQHAERSGYEEVAALL